MTEVIQTTHSVVDCQSIQNVLEKHFYFSGVIACFLMIRGMNDTYKLVTKDGRNFAVRVTTNGRRHVKDIEAEHQILSYLVDAGVQVLRPFKSIHDSYVVTLLAPEGERYLTVTHWQSGLNLRQTQDKKGIYKLGCTIAKMHLCAIPEQIPIRPLDLITELWSFLPVVEQVLYDKIAFLDAYKTAIQLVSDKLLDKELTIPYGFCHGDLHAGNAIIFESEVTLIDFDTFGAWYLCFDVASFLWSVDLFNWEKEYKTIFLNGYNSVKTLSASEIELMPYFMLARDLRHIATCSKNMPLLGCGWFSEGIFEKRQLLLNQLLEKVNN